MIAGKAVKLVHTVSAANNKIVDAINIENLSIFGKKQIWILRLNPNSSTIPCGEFVIRDR